MTNRFADTKTFGNLANSYSQEVQSRFRYEKYAEKARIDGFESIALVFIDTANNDSWHAWTYYRFLSADMSQHTIVIQTPVIISAGTTETNLYQAAMQEHSLHIQYPSYAATAKQEGFPRAAEAFSTISSVKMHHEERFMNLFTRYSQGLLYSYFEPVPWKCQSCGFIVEAKSAPERCACCGCPQTTFSMYCVNEPTTHYYF